MAVELFIEQPVGHRTEDSQFRPGELVRIAGRVAMWGLWPGPVGVELTIYDQGGEVVDSVRTSTNFVGNFWWDVALPGAVGSYAVHAQTSALGSAVLAFSISAAAVHTEFELSLDPRSPVVGGQLKATARALADGLPLQGLAVYFIVYPPGGGAPATLIAPTNSQGAAGGAWPVYSPGLWTVVAEAPEIGRIVRATATAVLPTDPEHPSEPTPGPPEAELPGGSDAAALLGPVMALALLGMLAGMAGGLPGRE